MRGLRSHLRRVPIGTPSGDGGEDGFAAFLAPGEEHAVGFEAAHFAGGEVGDDDDAAADEVFGGVPLGDAGEDLAFFVPEVDFEAEEFVGFGDALGEEDFGDAELDFDEVVDGDLGGGVGGAGCARGLTGEDAAGLGFGVRGRGAVVGGFGERAGDGKRARRFVERARRGGGGRWGCCWWRRRMRGWWRT